MVTHRKDEIEEPGNPNNQKQMVVAIWQLRSFSQEIAVWGNVSSILFGGSRRNILSCVQSTSIMQAMNTNPNIVQNCGPESQLRLRGQTPNLIETQPKEDPRYTCIGNRFHLSIGDHYSFRSFHWMLDSVSPLYAQGLQRAGPWTGRSCLARGRT